MTDWKNCIGNLYVSYAYEEDVDSRLVRMLELYPFFFTDDYWYWRPRARGRNRAHGRARMNCGDGKHIIKRSPIWTYPQKSIAAEHPKDPFQVKLTAIKTEVSSEK